MNNLRLVYSIIAIAFGAFVFVFGGYDDSPGAQLLGVLLVIGGIVAIVRSKRKQPK